MNFLTNQPVGSESSNCIRNGLLRYVLGLRQMAHRALRVVQMVHVDMMQDDALINRPVAAIVLANTS